MNSFFEVYHTKKTILHMNMCCLNCITELYVDEAKSLLKLDFQRAWYQLFVLVNLKAYIRDTKIQDFRVLYTACRIQYQKYLVNQTRSILGCIFLKARKALLFYF